MEDSGAACTEDVNLKYAAMMDSVQEATESTLPKRTVHRQRPWIRDSTLQLIEHRNSARLQGMFGEERYLNKQIRIAVRDDRSRWLDDLVASGSYDAIRKLRKGFCNKQGRLKKPNGAMAASEERANVLAKHLQDVQSVARQTSVMQNQTQLNPELPVDPGDITLAEVMAACRRLKTKRAAGVDNIPAEVWKSLASPDSPCIRWIPDLCQTCWKQKKVPDSWHDSRTALIFKKGDVAEPSNYRPISLLCISYKIFANIKLDRLRQAGAEELIWPTQFGFRKRRGTRDALFLARRILEENLELKDGRVVYLALDWARAFDSISPDALAKALARFGLPVFYIDMVNAIYSNRRFFVSDAGIKSDWHEQAAGISQGCPLSPFLFILLMTVLLADAKAAACASKSYHLPEHFPSELVYADDTIIRAAEEASAHTYMLAIEKAGREYGLCLNWSKCEVMPVRTHGIIKSPEGVELPIKVSITYLGSLISSDGRVATEISRRLGKAKGEFHSLKRVWMHANVGLQRKLQIFNQCVLSGLMYGLSSAVLNKASRRRLDGFQAACLRQIMHIPHAYWSRISNLSVLQKAAQKPTSELLQNEQQKYVEELRCRQPSDPVRSSILSPNGPEFRPLPGKRRVGRPRLTWTSLIV